MKMLMIGCLLSSLTCLGAQATSLKTTPGEHATFKSSEKIYKEISMIAPYFKQGKVIFNTSMPDDGSAHYYTDNSGFEWGPTALYQRLTNGAKNQLKFDGSKIPADIHVAPNGKYLYFTDYGDNPSRIYRAERVEDNWGNAEPFEAIPEGSGYVTTTVDEVMVFSKDQDIYELRDNQISKLPESINSAAGEHDPFIAQDGSFLIFVREDAKGDSNMYISVNTPSGWSEAEKLPSPFNAEKVDGSPYVTPDKKYLFFSSNRGGEVLQTWQAPIHDYLINKLAQTISG